MEAMDTVASTPNSAALAGDAVNDTAQIKTGKWINSLSV